MSTKRKRSKLLKEKFMQLGNTYCPLCMEPFRASTSTGTAVATLEHIPPKSIGGAPLCLTCQRCNNATGRETEAHLYNYVNNYHDMEMRIGNDDQLVSKSRVAINGTPTLSAQGGSSWNVQEIRRYWGNWEDRKAMAQVNTIRIYKHNEAILSRALAKMAYLVLGCATRGAVWQEDWTTPIREFILTGGNMPAQLYARREEKVNALPIIFKAKEAHGLPYGGWLVLHGHICTILAPMIDWEYEDDNIELGPGWMAEIAETRSGFPEYGEKGYW